MKNEKRKNYHESHVFPKKVVLLHNILRFGVFYYINNMYAYL